VDRAIRRLALRRLGGGVGRRGSGKSSRSRRPGDTGGDFGDSALTGGSD